MFWLQNRGQSGSRYLIYTYIDPYQFTMDLHCRRSRSQPVPVTLPRPACRGRRAGAMAQVVRCGATRLGYVGAESYGFHPNQGNGTAWDSSVGAPIHPMYPTTSYNYSGIYLNSTGCRGLRCLWLMRRQRENWENVFSPNSLLLGFYLRKKSWPHSLAAPLNSVAGLCGLALCPGLVLLLSSVAGLCGWAFLSSSCPCLDRAPELCAGLCGPAYWRGVWPNK